MVHQELLQRPRQTRAGQSGFIPSEEIPVKDKTWPRDKTWPPVSRPADPDLPRNKTMRTLNRMSSLMYCPTLRFDT